MSLFILNCRRFYLLQHSLVAAEENLLISSFVTIVLYLKLIPILTILHSFICCWVARPFFFELKLFKKAKCTALIVFEGTRDHIKTCLQRKCLQKEKVKLH
jgi:hypothetical protein